MKPKRCRYSPPFLEAVSVYMFRRTPGLLKNHSFEHYSCVYGTVKAFPVAMLYAVPKVSPASKVPKNYAMCLKFKKTMGYIHFYKVLIQGKRLLFFHPVAIQELQNVQMHSKKKKNLMATLYIWVRTLTLHLGKFWRMKYFCWKLFQTKEWRYSGGIDLEVKTIVLAPDETLPSYVSLASFSV